MDALRPAELPQSSGPCAHDHVRVGKQYIESMEIFGKSAVCYSGISELPLHYKERMLYLTACSGFPVLDVPFPLDSLVGVRYFDATGTDIGSEFHLRKMFVRFYLRTFCHPAVSRIAIHDFIILTDQLCGFIDVMYIG